MKKLIALATLTFISGLAMASEPGKSETGLDYNKIDVDYMNFKVSSTNFTGYTTQGSFLITDDIFILGSYASLKHTGSTTIERSNLGLGYRLGIAASTDAFGSLAYSSMTQSSTKTGYAATVGVRSKIADPVDVMGSYTYSTASTNHYNTVNVGLNYKFTDMFFATAGYGSTTGSASVSTYTLGVGVKF
jgi:opacity protein-like surface antigen